MSVSIIVLIICLVLGKEFHFGISVVIWLIWFVMNIIRDEIRRTNENKT